jgi:hypothetical protein
MNLIRALLLVCCTVACAASGQADSWTVDRELAGRALGCLLTEEWVQNSAKEIGIQPGSSVSVRARGGSVPRTSPSTPSAINLVLYSPDGQRGRFLMVVRRVDGALDVVANLYHLTRTDGQWVASEGNGGVATYRAIARYATDLEAGSEVLKLIATPKPCRRV